VNSPSAVLPFSAWNTKDFFNFVLSHHVSDWVEVVAERWVLALASDVIDVETVVTLDNVGCGLTLVNSYQPWTSCDESLASDVSTNKNSMFSLRYKAIFEGKMVVLRVLEEWINKPISDSNTLNGNVELILVLKHEVVSDSWDEVTGIRFSSDEEVFSLQLRESVKELRHKFKHVL